MNRRIIVLGVFLALTISPASILFGQQGAAAAEQQDAKDDHPQVAGTVLLKEGTEVRLELAQQLTGRSAVVGDPVEFVLAEDLLVGEALVARKGARVLGSVMEGKESEKKRRQPKSLRVRVDFLKVGDSKIPLRGEQAAVGKRNKNAMIAGSAALGLTGLLLTMGKKYQIPAGTSVIAYVDQDVELPPLQ